MRSKLIVTPALALLALAPMIAAPSASHAQTAYQAALEGRHNGGFITPNSSNLTPMATTPASGDPDYTDTFAGVTSEVTAAITGPGKLAIGVMVLGVVFSVVWKLVRKGGKAIGS